MIDGRYLRHWRLTHGYTQRDVAILCGCSVSTIRDWELEKSRPLPENEEKIQRLMHPLRVKTIGGNNVPNCKICGQPVEAVTVAHDECRRKEAQRLADNVCAYRCKMAVICEDRDALIERHCVTCDLPKLVKL